LESIKFLLFTDFQSNETHWLVERLAPVLISMIRSQSNIQQKGFKDRKFIGSVWFETETKHENSIIIR